MTASGLPPVTGLLLAAGEGRRMGGPKALLRAQPDGVTYVERGVRVLQEGGCRDVLVVVGAEGERVRSVLASSTAEVVQSREWATGMGASLRAGLTALALRGRTVPAAALVHLVDLPDVGADVVGRVLDHGAGSDAGELRAALARAAYQGVPGHPVLLGQRHWDEVLASAGGDRGARVYLRRAKPDLVECGDLATGRDVDTLTELRDAEHHA